MFHILGEQNIPNWSEAIINIYKNKKVIQLARPPVKHHTQANKIQ